VLEWCREPRDLTVYVSHEGDSLVRAWGASIEHEMTDADLTGVDDLVAAWSWIEQAGNAG